jgi:sulfite dehydrogenase
VNVSTAQGSGGTTAATTTSGTTTSGTTTAGTTTGGTTTSGGSGADLAAGKTAFVATCGGCHALKDAGTSGNVGPNLDSLAPLTADRVAKQIANGGAVMPAKLLTGRDAANVAAYVASVAGK